VLCVGVTTDLERRLREHKTKAVEGFTNAYYVDRLVYFGIFADVRDAIAREKQIQGWRRSQKVALIEARNPKWLDLSEKELCTPPAAPPFPGEASPE
jgi:putative endonuclease